MKAIAHKLSIAVFFLLLVTPVACSQPNSKTEIKLQNKKFKKLIDNSIDFTVPLLSVKQLQAEMDEYIILDAREREEYMVSHIPGAIYIGYDEVDLGKLKSLEKGKKLLFYCSIGYRSEKIGEKAIELGFKEVYNLYGSIFEWANEGFELVDSEEKPTKKVHGYSWLWGRWVQNKEYEKVYE